MSANQQHRAAISKVKDQLWKSGIDAFFQYAVEYFLADYAHEFDFSVPIISLDAELAKLYPDNAAAGRIADKLGRIKTKDGRDQWVLLHAEFQGTPDPEFDQRMFEMYVRIYDRYKKDVISLAVLTDKSKSFTPGEFKLGRAGTSLVFKYNTFKLNQYKRAELIKGKNPFGFMLMAAHDHIYGGNSDQAKYANKMTALRILFAAGLPKEQTRKLAAFIMFYTRFEDKSFITKLQEQAKAEFEAEMKTMTIEEVANWYLKEVGREEGMEVGIEKGKEAHQYQVARMMLQDNKPITEIMRYTGLTQAQIEKYKASNK